MRRPGLVTGIILAQLLLALALLALSLFLLLEARSPEVTGAPDAAEDVRGLRLAAGILAAPALALLVAFPGLWRGRRWGWSLAVLVNAGLTGVFVYSLIDDGLSHPDFDLLGITLALVVEFALLFLPGILRFFWRGGASPPPAGPPGTPAPAE